MAVPMTGQFVTGALTLFVARIEKLKLGALVKENCTAADAPEPVMCAEPGVMVMGRMGFTTGVLAEKLKLSIATSCAVPSVSACQTSQSVLFGGQLVMTRLVTPMLIWLAGDVP